MEISYIILAHKEPAQVRRLVQRLITNRSNFYIHVDIKVDIAPFHEALKDIPNVYLLDNSRRVASTWASPGLVKATLNAIQKIIEDKRNGYAVLMSGQCYPIKTNHYIFDFLEQNNGYNFIEGFSLPDVRWGSTSARLQNYTFFLSDKKGDFISLPSIKEMSFNELIRSKYWKKYLKVFMHTPLQSKVLLRKREMPYILKPYGGMQWWALPIDTLRFILRYVNQNPDYLKYHEHTLFSDEVFFQTLVYNFFDNIHDSIAYSPWPGIDISSSPKTFTSADIELLKGRPELFARKFDVDNDSSILNLLDEIETLHAVSETSS